MLAGDSSGGNLVTASQILLLTLAQHGKTRMRSPWHASTDSNTDGHECPVVTILNLLTTHRIEPDKYEREGEYAGVMT